MKYEGSRKSKDGKEKEIFIFSVGKEELRLLLAVTSKALLHTPRIFETTQLLGRLRNIVKEIVKILKTERNSPNQKTIR